MSVIVFVTFNQQALVLGHVQFKIRKCECKRKVTFCTGSYTLHDVQRMFSSLFIFPKTVFLKDTKKQHDVPMDKVRVLPNTGKNSWVFHARTSAWTSYLWR